MPYRPVDRTMAISEYKRPITEFRYRALFRAKRMRFLQNLRKINWKKDGYVEYAKNLLILCGNSV